MASVGKFRSSLTTDPINNRLQPSNNINVVDRPVSNHNASFNVGGYPPSTKQPPRPLQTPIRSNIGYSYTTAATPISGTNTKHIINNKSNTTPVSSYKPLGTTNPVLQTRSTIPTRLPTTGVSKGYPSGSMASSPTVVTPFNNYKQNSRSVPIPPAARSSVAPLLEKKQNSPQQQKPPPVAFKPSSPTKQHRNEKNYKVVDSQKRKVSIDSIEDWDAIADHAAIEWGQRRGPRRGRDADDLTVTVRDIAPSLTRLLDTLGCCGEKKTRVLHRPHVPCTPIPTVITDTNTMLSNVNDTLQFPQGVLLESNIIGMGTQGVGCNHGINQYGGYRYYGERDDAAPPSKYADYDQWKTPSNTNFDRTMKTPLPQFEQSYHNRAFNAAPGTVDVKAFRQILQNSDLIQTDEKGRAVVPEFEPTKDGKIDGGVRI